MQAGAYIAVNLSEVTAVAMFSVCPNILNRLRSAPGLRWAILVLLLGMGCREKPAYHAPPPAAAAFTPPPPPPLSLITVPVEVDLEELAAQANARLPETLVEENTLDKPDGRRITARRGKIGFTLQEGKLHWEAPVEFEACKHIAFIRQTLCCEGRFVEQFVTGVGIIHGWRLQTRTVPAGRRWEKKCRVSVIGGKLVEDLITDLLDRELDREAAHLATEIDARIAEYADLRPQVEPVWQALQQPIPVPRVEQAYLLIQPEGAVVGQVQGEGRRAQLIVGVQARPRVIVGEAPSIIPVPLPDSLHPATDDRSVITLEVGLDYPEATRQVWRHVADKTFRVGGKAVQIRKLRLFGSGSLLVAEVHLTGDFTGTVYFTGKPVYDQAAQAIRLEGLEFDLRTRDVLVKAAEWLLHGAFRRELQQQARWEIGDRIRQAREALEAALNRTIEERFYLSGKIDRLAPLGVYVTPEQLLLRVGAEGRVRLKVVSVEIGALSSPEFFSHFSPG
ncbi:MAG: DUF4403 family protein [Calditrichaeota bacterium]|nr:MAG: DUF4403 family protein [Calditrichota bacterium]